jgi:hypothetical protein
MNPRARDPLPIRAPLEIQMLPTRDDNYVRTWQSSIPIMQQLVINGSLTGHAYHLMHPNLCIRYCL